MLCRLKVGCSAAPGRHWRRMAFRRVVSLLSLFVFASPFRKCSALLRDMVNLILACHRPWQPIVTLVAARYGAECRSARDPLGRACRNRAGDAGVTRAADTIARTRRHD